MAFRALNILFKNLSISSHYPDIQKRSNIIAFYCFLFEEKLLNPNQSSFRPSDSCINQLLAINHEIFEAF